jgi:methylated-DNA-[protein]-cysteine S-methyltransferase
MRRIPRGKTISYAELAWRVGCPKGARAAGGASRRNPISLLVPCHRVVGTSGALTGYGGGLRQKRFLLNLEA